MLKKKKEENAGVLSGADKYYIEENKTVQGSKKNVWGNKVTILGRVMREGFFEEQLFTGIWMKRSSQSGEGMGEMSPNSEV